MAFNETGEVSGQGAEANGGGITKMKMFQAKKPFSLEVRWNAHLSQLRGGQWQKPLTQRERGQLKNLANALGSRTHEVMDWALENWSKFAKRAESAAGLSTSPGEPHIGFLLTHCAEAVNQLQSIAEDKKASEEMRKEFQAEQAKRDPARAEKAARLAELNQQGIEHTLARFAAAGEPPPVIRYNDYGEVVHIATKKELSEWFSDLDRLVKAKKMNRT